MNGVFNPGLNFWEFLGIFIVAVLSIIAIRISFDINKFLDRHDKNNVQKLKNKCPHFSLILLERDRFEVRSLYYKPMGTLDHVCRQCGLQTALDMDQHERQANQYVKNPSQLFNDQKSFLKLAKRSGKV